MIYGATCIMIRRIRADTPEQAERAMLHLVRRQVEPDDLLVEAEDGEFTDYPGPVFDAPVTEGEGGA